ATANLGTGFGRGRSLADAPPLAGGGSLSSPRPGSDLPHGVRGPADCLLRKEQGQLLVPLFAPPSSWYAVEGVPRRLAVPHSPAIDAREAAILARAIQPNNHNLSATAARALLRIQLAPVDRQRLHELLVKNQEDRLTADERGELESHLHVGMLLDLLQAKA